VTARLIADINRVLHLVLCLVHEFLRSALYIFARGTDVLDSIADPRGNIVSKLFSSLGRNE
jgi:hypothetical protein